MDLDAWQSGISIRLEIYQGHIAHVDQRVPLVALTEGS